MTRRLADIKELLARKEYRFTPQREAILRVLVANVDSHLTADEVYRKTKETYPELGVATVYRTLEIFENLGIIHRLQFGEEGALYEFNPDFYSHYHHHLICLGCGGIFEFNEDLLDDIEQAISERTGFYVVDHSLTIYGYCKRCEAERTRADTGEDGADPGVQE